MRRARCDERTREPHREQCSVAPADTAVLEDADELAQALDDHGLNASRGDAELPTDPFPDLAHLGCLAGGRVAGEPMSLADCRERLAERCDSGAGVGPRSQVERDYGRLRRAHRKAAFVAPRLEARPLVAVRVMRPLSPRGRREGTRVLDELGLDADDAAGGIFGERQLVGVGLVECARGGVGFHGRMLAPSVPKRSISGVR